MQKRLDEAVLHGIKGIGFLAKESVRNPISQRPIPPEQLLQGLPIPSTIARN
jgi:hypothetical protein